MERIAAVTRLWSGGRGTPGCLPRRGKLILSWCLWCQGMSGGEFKESWEDLISPQLCSLCLNSGPMPLTPFPRTASPGEASGCTQWLLCVIHPSTQRVRHSGKLRGPNAADAEGTLFVNGRFDRPMTILCVMSSSHKARWPCHSPDLGRRCSHRGCVPQ